MKLERSRRNLPEKLGTDRNLKWDEIYSVLFRFLNWYRMFRPFRTKRNGINNLGFQTIPKKWKLFLGLKVLIFAVIILLEKLVYAEFKSDEGNHSTGILLHAWLCVDNNRLFEIFLIELNLNILIKFYI
jgi:hypothetical protein